MNLDKRDSNEYLQQWLEHFNYEYLVLSDSEACEGISFDTMKQNSMRLTSVILAFISNPPNYLVFGDYKYGQNIYNPGKLVRTSPKIPKPKTSKLGYNIVKTFKKVVA